MNFAGFGLIAFLILFFPLCGLIGWRITLKRQAASSRIDPAYWKPDPVAPAPVHVHILDLERSDPRVTEIGGVMANCIVAHCQETIYISPSLARMYIGQELEVRG